MSYEIVWCDACMGKGSEVCSHCNGVGCTECNNTGREDCEVCGGFGCTYEYYEDKSLYTHEG